MPRKCNLCEKKVMSGNKVSHSNRKTKRTYGVNVHKVTLEIDGKVSRDYVCTRCLRTLKNA